MEQLTRSQEIKESEYDLSLLIDAVDMFLEEPCVENFYHVIKTTEQFTGAREYPPVLRDQMIQILQPFWCAAEEIKEDFKVADDI